MLGYLVVFLGGGAGAALRHGVNRVVLLIDVGGFPLSTFFVNILGCFVMGLLTGWFTWRGEASSRTLRLLLTTGVLGGFTTFSTFSLDAALLWERGQVGMALVYGSLSVELVLVGVFLRLAFSRALFSCPLERVVASVASEA